MGLLRDIFYFSGDADRRSEALFGVIVLLLLPVVFFASHLTQNKVDSWCEESRVASLHHPGIEVEVNESIRNSELERIASATGTIGNDESTSLDDDTSLYEFGVEKKNESKLENLRNQLEKRKLDFPAQLLHFYLT